MANSISVTAGTTETILVGGEDSCGAREGAGSRQLTAASSSATTTATVLRTSFTSLPLQRDSAIRPSTLNP
jgi:hypothetical protein